MTEFKRISPEQAQALREQGAVVVDVRDSQTYATHCISVGFKSPGQRFHLGLYPCRRPRRANGGRPLLSRQLQPKRCRYLISQGFSDVYSMDGGFELWRTNYPSETAQGTSE
jgi:thiosulfate sulfurtransferase